MDLSTLPDLSRSSEKALSVMIADADEMTRGPLRRYLKALRHNVAVEATDGPAAVQLAHFHKPDVVFVDFDLPGHGGLQAASAILAERIVPMILVARLDDLRQLGESPTGRGIVRLMKPFSFRQVFTVITLALARHQLSLDSAATLANRPPPAPKHRPPAGTAGVLPFVGVRTRRLPTPRVVLPSAPPTRRVPQLPA